MPSYVVTGAGRGLGVEFLRQLSENPDAIVIGLARNVEAAKKKAAETGRPNIHIIHGDLDDYESLKKAAEETAKITGGSLDYLIANGAYISGVSASLGLFDLGENPKALDEDLEKSFRTNVYGNIHLINFFLPLIQKGQAKKVISISTGLADFELTKEYKIEPAGPYAMSKAALNLAIAKYHAQFASEGILFFSISPGMVATDANTPPITTEREQKKAQQMYASFAQYAPHFKGPITPKESVEKVLGVIYDSSLEKGDGGAFVSHLGRGQPWI
ncbi:NAD(P)-binding protein [Daldinia caldariorum]|uniref:NAD(P)-binding protein n=1 Tax=Daldinia caldariorum TaxID=326644 RepID=UPI002007CBE5|nr:NAD(P)-binding protein [Daldinia caldariorum]KAI1468316.1 NAD(P)-binding protein [Daldinia caldariorum]